jgi:hypothetical protein
MLQDVFGAPNGQQNVSHHSNCPTLAADIVYSHLLTMGRPGGKILKSSKMPLNEGTIINGDKYKNSHDLIKVIMYIVNFCRIFS